MKILFVLIGFVFIVVVIVFGGIFWIFVNVFSLLIVVGLILCVFLVNHFIVDVLNAFKTVFSSGDVDPNEGHRHVMVLQTFRMVVIGLGILGTFIGLVQMF